jgi:hypothetical protein
LAQVGLLIEPGARDAGCLGHGGEGDGAAAALEAVDGRPCGSPRCRCHDDPTQLHGPYPSWIRKLGDRTITHTLSREQAEGYRPMFDNSRRLRELVSELHLLGAQLVDQAEGWVN